MPISFYCTVYGTIKSKSCQESNPYTIRTAYSPLPSSNMLRNCYGPYEPSVTTTESGARRVGKRGTGHDGTSRTMWRGMVSESHDQNSVYKYMSLSKRKYTDIPIFQYT